MFNHRRLYLIVLTVTLLIPIIFLSKLWVVVIAKVYERNTRQDAFFRRSFQALHKFDSIRKYGQHLGDLKPASNSYITEFIIPTDRDTVHGERENATILMLCRNWELDGVLESMRSLEDRFNRRFHYDWTFLNDVTFDDVFIEATTAMASGKTQYALIPREEWNKPDWIDNELFESRLQLMHEKRVIYGGSKSYRNMCRFNSGFFFKQKILDQYDYYFRVEPDVKYYCDFPYDPFKVMREQKKKYGFVISMHEYEDTIPTLWDAVEEFMDLYPELIHPNNSLDFVTDSSMIGRYTPIIDSNSDYNLCHFWSNFEIGDLNFFRSDGYKKYFEYLDSKGGFYYERWGDAPVHSIAVSLLLDKNEVHHFDEIGYMHVPFNTCPSSYTCLLYTSRCV